MIGKLEKTIVTLRVWEIFSFETYKNVFAKLYKNIFRSENEKKKRFSR